MDMKSQTKEKNKQVGDRKIGSAENMVANGKTELVKEKAEEEQNIVLSNVSVKKRRSRKRSKRALNKSAEKIEEITKEKCEKQLGEVKCLQEEGDKKDELIDKLKTNVELFETFEKFVKVFDDTKDSG